jgi:hypothetical protein
VQLQQQPTGWLLWDPNPSALALLLLLLPLLLHFLFAASAEETPSHGLVLI